MADFELTRRKALAGVGGAAVLGSATLLDDAAEALSGGGWTDADTDTASTLHDVATTSGVPFAVGSGGVVLERTGEAAWTTVVESGPDGDGNDLFAADATDDGAALWFAGASGALGEYEVASGEVTAHDPLADRSAPTDETGNFDALAVTGSGDGAHVYAATQSGHVFTSHDGGETWSDATPGSGSAIPAVDFRGERTGHLCDTDGAVFATSDGETWNRIGIEDADVSYAGVESDGSDDATVVGGNGTVREYDGTAWSETNVGDAALHAVATGDDERVAVGAGGTVVTGAEWGEVGTPTGENLHGIAVGERALAVGASGTVIER